MKTFKERIIRRYEDFIIRRFHSIYYNGRHGDGNLFFNTYWMQTLCLKCPLDVWIYQEIIAEVKPDLIIETGTHKGGSALYLAHVLDIIGKGEIVTIDVEVYPRPTHPRIHYVTGSSTDEATIRSAVQGRKRDSCLVILDSDHRRDHVLREMELLSPYVTLGSYMIVEDSNVNGHPTNKEYGPGPYEAIEAFLKDDDSFEIDYSREKFLMTFNPNGYLKRVAPVAEPRPRDDSVLAGLKAPSREFVSSSR